MSPPRRLVPRQTHFVTRRTSRRCAFLKGTPRVNQILLYCLGLAQERCPGLEIHAFTSEVTHYHSSLSDARGDALLSKFMHDLNGNAARAFNAHYGRGENFWTPNSYDNVEVHDLPTLEDQLLYVWTQCVKDGLHPDPSTWEGICFLPEDFGRTFTIEKPDEAFFGGRWPADWVPTHPPARRAYQAARRRRAAEERRRQQARDKARARARARNRRRRRRLAQSLSRPRGRRPRQKKERAPRPPRRRDTLPDRVTIRITPPPGYEHMTLAEVRAHFRRLLDERIQEILAEREAEGLTTFLGLEALRAQDPLESVGDTFPTFSRNPTIACIIPELRVAHIQNLQAFRSRYRDCLRQWQAGDRQVRFPRGSYWLPRFHGALVEEIARAPPDLV